MFQGETEQLPMLNQLLIDIIDAELILADEKENLIQLLDIICKKTTFSPELSAALNAFQNLLKHSETEHDREHILQYEKYLKRVVPESKLSENIYALSNTSTTTIENSPTQPIQPKTGV